MNACVNVCSFFFLLSFENEKSSFDISKLNLNIFGVKPWSNEEMN